MTRHALAARALLPGRPVGGPQRDRALLTLAHQSLADLELVSKEFATAVWDNTRTKDILNQDNPELCERIARSIGTHQIRELTVRRKEGLLLTSLATGDSDDG